MPGGTVDADALRRGHVERARHRAHPDRRRYLAVAPDNRLVAASREADWNDALRALQTAREDYQRASEAAAASLLASFAHRVTPLLVPRTSGAPLADGVR